MAIALSQQLNLPYLRYERPPLLTATEESFETFEHLLQSGILSGQRVLLTLGYRPLHHFFPWQHQATLFARILPSITALDAALVAGFTPDRLIALRPPISAELERSLWRQWQISLVVTKASGAPGGEDVKRQVAAELGVTLAVVERPAIAYPAQTSEVSLAVQFCIRQVHRTAPSEKPPPTGGSAG
jgi:precorrin-6A/cobalt-precorrin-6A reductase